MVRERWSGRLFARTRKSTKWHKRAATFKGADGMSAEKLRDEQREYTLRIEELLSGMDGVFTDLANRVAASAEIPRARP